MSRPGNQGRGQEIQIDESIAELPSIIRYLLQLVVIVFSTTFLVMVGNLL